jgi:NADH-quinone oxidoreductase subunit G
MGTVLVNGKPVEIAAGERLNCVQAAQRADVEIPHYCWHPELSVVASCRMCLVEVGEKKPDGTVVMQPKLLPGCQTPVNDGTVVVSDSPKVKQAQAATLEYLLLNHPLDCPVCDQAGECFLQDYSYKYGRGASRLQDPKLIKPDKDHIGPQITLFTDRCVMCSRCVRFTREVSGTSELMVVQRGSHAEIDVFPGEPCDNRLAGNVVDICPVGALCSKDFLYKQRVWWLSTKPGVCPDCSTGCSIQVDQNEDVLYRLRPRPNPQAQGSFMCDDGRFGWKYVLSPDRLTTPLVARDGKQSPAAWDEALPAVRSALRSAATKSPSKLAAVLSPWLTVEEAYLLAKFVKDLSASTQLFLGPVRIEGQDDCYPKDVHGNAQPKTRFTIRAEKCPDRRGVSAVLEHFEGRVRDFEAALQAVNAGTIETLYLAGGDPHAPLGAEQAAALGKLSLLVVQDLLPSAASTAAKFVLPGGSFAERDGTFVNHAGLAQAIHRALRGPGESRPDGRILWELSERRGLFHAPTLRREIAEAIPALAALAVGDLGEQGVRLDQPAAGANGTAVPGGIAAAAGRSA